MLTTFLLSPAYAIKANSSVQKKVDPMLQRSLLCAATIQYLIDESDEVGSVQAYLLAAGWRNEFINQLQKVTGESKSKVMLRADTHINSATSELSRNIYKLWAGNQIEGSRMDEARRIWHKTCVNFEEGL